MITREYKTIRLSWAKIDLFQAVCTETAYNARTLADDKGQPLFDRFAMTEDERAFFDLHFAKALYSLLQHFRRIVPDSLPLETDSDIGGITFTSRQTEDGTELFGQAELDAVNRVATDVIRAIIIAEWYLSLQAADLWTAYLQKIAAAAAELSTLLFRFYRPALGKAYMVTPDPEEYPAKEYEINIDAGTV